MQKMQCELCGSLDIIKVEQDCFQCQHCGCKYTLAQAKMLISGTVEVVKGQAELERKLKNADAQIRYGAYDDADRIYAELAEEYPDQHIVWQKALACKRAALLSGYRKLDGALALHMFQLWRRLCISAENDEIRKECEQEEELFWQCIRSKQASGQNIIDEIDIFHAVFEQRKKGIMPMECIAESLWDDIGRTLLLKVRNREYVLMTKTFAESADYALLKCNLNKDENYADVMLLEDMHPSMESLIAAGRKNAIKLNAEATRMGMIYGVRPIWLKNGREELKELYVTITFAVQGIIFGDYVQYSSGIRPEKKFVHKNKDLSTQFANLRREETAQKSIDWWNRTMFSCPYCGAHPMIENLFGRKCRFCGRKIPRM